MLCLEIRKVAFHKKTILRDVKLLIPNGAITCIIGEIGSGKSTIINALTFKNKFASCYDVNGINLKKLNKEEKSQFIRQYYCIVYQIPHLLEDLTVQQHIDLVMELSNSNLKYEEWVSCLELDELVGSYPKKLSGGEQMRVSLLLSLLKNPDVLILDEPTSSLDEYYTKKVMEVVRKFSELNKTVIIATHDPYVMKQSDLIYQIKNQEVKLVHCDIEKEDYPLQLDKVGQKDSYRKVTPCFRMMKKHNKLYKKMMTCLTVYVIALAAFFTEFDNAVKMSQINQMNDMTSNELIIYKPTAGIPNYDGQINAESNEIVSEQELLAVKNISHVRDVKSRMDISMSYPFGLMADDSILYNLRNFIYPLEFKKDGQILFSKEIPLEDEDSLIPHIHPYFKDENYEKNIEVQFQDEGVFISKHLAEVVTNGDISKLNGAMVSCDIRIPVYNSVGKSWTILENMDEENNRYYHTGISSEAVEINLPIAGVLKGSSMGILEHYWSVIYIEDDILKQYLEELKVTDPRTVYVVDTSYDHFEYYIDELPEGKEAEYTVEETPWTPRQYSVFIDDVSAMEDVVKELTRLGFSVSNEYFEAQAISSGIDTYQRTVKLIAYSVCVVVLVIYVAIKYNNRQEEKAINQFFVDQGYTHLEIMKIKRYKYLNETIRMIIYSSVLLALNLVICNEVIHYGYTSFGLMMFMVLIGLNGLIEYVVPMMIERSTR